MAATVDVGDEGIAESATKQVFSSYVCRTITDRGMPHPGDVAEASSLAAVPLPPSSYPLWDSLPPDLVSSGKLSTLQLEGILYACTKHCEMLPSGERAGFFIGDGAGVGKGRQISGVILDNFARGRRRALWLSTSSDLHADATRDLRDLGCHLNVINNVAALDRESRALGLAKEYREGVLFMTYSTLISQVKGRSRLQQVIDWLVFGSGTNGGGATGAAAAAAGGDGGGGGGAGAASAASAAAAAALSAWDGLIVLDECHRAKNFVPGKEAASTKVASAVIALQEMLPRARVLYCSATGVSEVGNMAYMVRMGLWGVGTAFSDFTTFLDSMRRRGVSFMELLAMEMKAEGKYVARGLSFREAEFSEVEAPLTEQQIRMYDGAVHVWSRLKTQLEAALEVTGGGRDVWKAFWSTQQRFFKLLCVSLKVPTVVREAREALAAGQCVVIGLQSTGEAAADAVGLEPGPCPGFVSPTKEMLLRFVAQHFPTRKAATEAGGGGSGGGGAGAGGGGGGGAYGSYHDEPVPPPPLGASTPPTGAGKGGKRGGGAAAAAAGKAPEEEPEIPACVSMREELLAAVDSLQLPPNFLDEIVDQLGGPGRVVEMTGRKGRVVRLVAAGAGAGQQAGGGGGGGGAGGGGRSRLVYELRAKPDSTEMDSLNITEKDAFLRGCKLVAIISDAASTGISLHASRAAANQRRRLHLTIELPWSADKAIQQLGRSHRSNQVSAPLYKLISTRIGGEKRFAAAVARRLQSLGALTRGDRRAASGVDLSDCNFDSPIGRKSLRRMYDHIMLPTAILPQGVTLAEVFREHPALAKAFAPGGGGGAGTIPARRASGAVDPDPEPFLYDDPAVVQLHVTHLHEACRKYCEAMGLELPTPKPGAAAAAAREAAAGGRGGGGGGGGDAATSDASSKDAGDGRGSGGDVRRFLNRLLGLRVEAQGLLFAYYSAVLGADIQKARAEGKYSEGLADVAGTRIRLQSRSTLWVDPLSKLATTNTAFSVDRGLSWEAAKRRLERERLPGDCSGFRMSRRPLGPTHLVLLALQKPGARNLFTIARPNTGAAYFDMDRGDLEAKYLAPPTPGSAAEAQLEALWRTAYEGALSQCSHGPGCRLGPDCGVGRRITTVNVLGGSVVRVWGVLEAVLARREAELPKMERTLRVVRVEWDENDHDGDDGDGGGASAASAAAAARHGGPGTGGDGGDDDDVTEGRPAPASPQVTLSWGSGDGGEAAAAAVTSTADTTATAAAGHREGAGEGNGGRRRTSCGGGGGSGSGGSGSQHVVGVRFPGTLLGEVVLALHTAATQATLTQLPGGAIGLRPPPASASASAAASKLRAEAPAPVDPRSLAQAFRAPRTLMDFFRKQESDPAAAGAGAAGAGAAGAGAVSGSQCGGGGSRQPGAETGPGSGSARVLQLPLGPRAVAQLQAEAAAAGGGGGAAARAPGALPSVAAPVAVKREREQQQQQRQQQPQPVGVVVKAEVPASRRVSGGGNTAAVAAGGSGGAGGGGGSGGAAPPAKRPKVAGAGAAAAAAGARGAGAKHPQQQHTPGGGGGGGGGIMAAFARGKQQQQQLRGGGRGGGGPPPPYTKAAAAADVIDVASIDRSERPVGRGGTAEVKSTAGGASAAAAAAGDAGDVILVDSNSDDDAVGGGGSAAAAVGGGGCGGRAGGGGVEAAAVLRSSRRIADRAAADGGGGGGEAGGEEVSGEGVGDAGVSVEGEDADDEEGDDGADGDFVVEDDGGGVDDGEEWIPSRQRRGCGGGPAAATATAGGRGRAQGRGRGGDGAVKRGGGGGGGGAYGGGGGGGAGGGPSAATLARLQGMGFPARQAEKALWMARGDFERAVELCLQGM